MIKRDLDMFMHVVFGGHKGSRVWDARPRLLPETQGLMLKVVSSSEGAGDSRGS